MKTDFVVASSGENELGEEPFARESAATCSRHKCSLNKLMPKEIQIIHVYHSNIFSFVLVYNSFSFFIT